MYLPHDSRQCRVTVVSRSCKRPVVGLRLQRGGAQGGLDTADIYGDSEVKVGKESPSMVGQRTSDWRVNARFAASKLTASTCTTFTASTPRCVVFSRGASGERYHASGAALLNRARSFGTYQGVPPRDAAAMPACHGSSSRPIGRGPPDVHLNKSSVRRRRPWCPRRKASRTCSGSLGSAEESVPRVETRRLATNRVAGRVDERMIFGPQARQTVQIAVVDLLVERNGERSRVH
jgi:hypothetical protein